MLIAVICTKQMYLTEDYKRDPVSMKDQDSLWIINTLNWYYKFSKSIVISFLISLGDRARHDPSLSTRAAMI
jgi:hypothetical protein